jgi:hypothetical protein
MPKLALDGGGASRVIPKLTLYKRGRKLEATAAKVLAAVVICEISHLLLRKAQA